MQKISLFHLFIRQIHLILEPYHMTGYNHMSTPKIFNHFCTNKQKSVNYISSFLKYSQC